MAKGVTTDVYPRDNCIAPDMREECRGGPQPDATRVPGRRPRDQQHRGAIGGAPRAQRCARVRRPGEAVLILSILSDSQLAICTTTGAWASRKHKALVARNRKALAQLRADGADVRIQHVRAHTGHGMNERADELAAQGAQGLRRRDNAIYVPLDGPRLPADTVPD